MKTSKLSYILKLVSVVITMFYVNLSFSQADLPNPPINNETLPQGTLIIPMDNDHQNVGAAFNLKAYGLIHELLQNDIPIKWIIKTGKNKDGIDFTATAERLYPSFISSSSTDFRASAFAIDSYYINNPQFPFGKTATQVITTYGNNVAVYMLTQETDVDVRYELNKRTNIGLLSNGGNEQVHVKILAAAGITNYNIISPGQFATTTGCYTFTSNAHWKSSDLNDTSITYAIRDYVNNGGNFLAQCIAVKTYENYNFSHSTIGIHKLNYKCHKRNRKDGGGDDDDDDDDDCDDRDDDDDDDDCDHDDDDHDDKGGGGGHDDDDDDDDGCCDYLYYNDDLAYMQFEGNMKENQGGALRNFKLMVGSMWKNGTYYGVSLKGKDTIVASGAHVINPNSLGGNVYYLSGHDYKPYNCLPNINAARLYLNASLVPSSILSPSPIDAGLDQSVCQGESVVLGGNPTGPASTVYSWIPAGSLNNSSLANPTASPSITTSYIVMGDFGGCQIFKDTVTVFVLPQEIVEAGADQVYCAGATSISLNGIITGGSGEGVWSTNGSGSFDPSDSSLTANYILSASDIASGSVTLYLQSINGCDSDSLLITIPVGLELQIPDTSLFCYDDMVNLNPVVTGGTPPYSYLWSNGMSLISINVGQGSHCLTITDAAGCMVSKCKIVSAPDQLQLDMNSSPTTSFGGNDGFAKAIPYGGTPPYNFFWANGAFTPTITGLSYGIYEVTVEDANGCTILGSVVVNDPRCLGFNAEVNGSTLLCNNDNNGTAHVSATGGTLPYSYIWNTPSQQTTASITNLSAGLYSVEVTDSRGCLSIAAASIFEPSALTSSILSENITTIGANDGSAIAIAFGGTPPYSYLWSTSATTQAINGLTAGVYFLTITDNNGCSINDSVNINDVGCNNFNLYVSGSQTTCNNNDGSASVVVIGAIQPYTILWSNSITTTTNSNLAPGSYTVNVTDANNCSSFQTITITEQNPPLETAILFTDIRCFGSPDGSIDLTIFGGAQPYSYNWSNGMNSEDLINLSQGNYSVTVTDNNGCMISDSVIINSPLEIAHNFSFDNISCFGDSNITVSSFITGGIFPYSFSWSNGSLAQNLSNASMGVYTLNITDGNNCITTATINITQPDSLTLSSTISDVNCFQGTDGAIDIEISGGTSPYTYLWSTGDTTEDLSSVGMGSYSVTVTDSNNCAVSSTFTINGKRPIVLSSSHEDVKCKGFSDGSIDLTVSGGVSPYSFLWNNNDTTEDISNLIAGTYTVIITDSNNCIKNDTILISEPDVLTISSVISHIECNGLLTGSIDLTIAGGTTPYSYFWSTGDTIQDISLLGAELYIVNVSDANNCMETDTIIVTEPDTLSIADSINHVSCFRGNDGFIDIDISGGVPPYTYLWSTGDTSEDLTGIIKGTYTVLVSDSNNCTINDTIVITEPDVLTLSSIISHIECNGLSTGSIDLTIAGGTTPYSYLWSTADTTQDISLIGAGLYIVNVSDANNCMETDTIIVTEPDALSITDTINHVSCFRGSDGFIDIDISGGVQPYTYLWSNGATSEDLTGIIKGTYTVTVRDSNNCNVSRTFTINEETPIILVKEHEDVLCNGLLTGSIDLTVQGGVLPYNYSWSNGSTTQDISNLIAGTYIVIITDSNNCILTDTIIITQPDELTISPLVSHVKCNGILSGSIDLLIAGGVTPYSYLWSTGDTIQDLSLIGAGLYGIKVSDANGCIKTDTIIVTEPDAIIITATIVDVTCNGLSNGSIDLSVSGGLPPYTYIWSNGDTVQDLLAIGQGTYTVTIADGNNCPATSTFEINEDPLLELSSNQQNIKCFGTANGSIDLSITGGVLPYSFAWNNGSSTEDISNLTAGTYMVIVTDSNNCTINDTIVITEPDSLSFSSSIDHVTCFGLTNGSIDLSVSGGVLPYSYLWSTGDTVQDLLALGQGSYSIHVEDNNGCVMSNTFILNEEPPLILNSDKEHVRCNGLANGSIDLIVTGGVLPYIYSWSNGANYEDLSDLSAGMYMVSVTDANLCNKNDTIIITEPDALSLSAAIQHVKCSGILSGSIDLIVAGGTSPYYYQWSNGSNSQDLTMIGAGSYTVQVLDLRKCKISEVYTITEVNPMNLSVNLQNVSCYGLSDATIDMTIHGGNQPYNISWSNGSNTEDISNLIAGTYIITVKDGNKCVKKDTIRIGEPQELFASIVSNIYQNGHNISLYQATDGSIELDILGGTPPYDFSWTNGTITQNLLDISAGIYGVQITDGNGCRYSVTMELTEPFDLKMPTIITVNGDGKNDFFHIRGLTSYASNTLLIFNRWGNQVYEMNNYDNKWNGKSSNGMNLPAGNYYVILSINNQEIVLTGFVEIYR